MNDEKQSLWQRLSGGLKRSSKSLSTGLGDIFLRKKADAQSLEELEDLLISSDLGVNATQKIISGLSKRRFEEADNLSEIRQGLAEELETILTPREGLPNWIANPARAHLALFVGVNGSGKTTSIGKITAMVKGEGARPVLAAGDTFRAAAIDQLKVWGERTQSPVIAKAPGADAAGLIYEAMEQAKRDGHDLIFADTAGRLQNKSELMEELAKIIRVAGKLDADAPHDVILVLDATAGQNALAQVEAFQNIANVSGLIMTKLDGTAKGGVLVAIAERFDIPIHYIGVGESIEDLQTFSAKAFAAALAGLEDLV